MNWKEDSSDIEECMVPFKGRVPKEYVIHLRKFLKEIIIVDSIEPDELDMMNWMSNSTSYNHLKTFKKFQRSYRLTLQDVIGQAFKYERSLIYVSPGNKRDAWKADPQTLLQLKYYDHMIKNLVKLHPKSAMCQDSVFDQRIQRVLNHDLNYSMIDLKKAGLTIPLELIEATLKELTDFLTSTLISGHVL